MSAQRDKKSQEQSGESQSEELQRLRRRVAELEHREAQRVEIERVHREDQERFRLFYERSPLGYQSLDADGRILEVNPAWLEILGYQQDQVVGRWFGDFLTPESRGVFAGRFTLFKEAGEVRDAPFEMICADGRTLCVEFDGRISRTTEGHFERTHCVMRDVTRRKKAEAAGRLSHRILEISHHYTLRKPMLQEAVSEIRAFAQCEAVGIRILDKDGNIPCEAYTGFSRECYERESPLSAGSDHDMCISVIEGRTDPTQPFFTPGGSFYRNATTRLLATVPEEDKGQTRNICNETGFESAALIPIRSDGDILGLIHLADSRENRFPLSLLETIECIGLQLGIAVRRAFAEEALRHSEREKSLILNSMSEMFFYLDTDLRIQWTNQAVEDVLGLSTEQCTGRRCYEVQFQRSAPCDGCSLMTVLQTGRPAEAEITCPDGSIRFLRSYPVLDDGGEIMGLVGFVQDVTERKRFEKALLESEQTYRTLVQSLPDIVMRFDREGRHLFVSDNVERGVDFSAARFVGKTHRELGFPEEHCRFWEEAIRRVFASGAPFETEFTIEGPRGPIIFNWRLSPELDARGVVPSVLSISRDITDRKRAEERLRAASDMLDLAPSAITVHDFEGRFLYANRKTFEIHGYTEPEFMALSLHELDAPESEALIAERMDTIGAQGEASFEVAHFRKDGSSLPLEIYAKQVMWEGVPAVLSIGTDITERKKAEQRQAELLHVSRLSTLGEMASGFAHELNQPLTAIMSFAGAALRSIQSGEIDKGRLAGNIERIVAQSTRAGEIIRRIRAFAQRRSCSLGYVDVNKVIRDALGLVGSDLRNKEIEVVLELSEDLPPVLADSIQLEQVLLNVMRNAIEAMETAGSPGRRLTLRTCTTGAGSVKSAVSDTGPRMPPELMAKVFDPFFTTKADGLGIGLSISRSIIEAHRGQLWVEPGPGRGCTFVFTLPAARSDSPNDPVETGTGQ